MTLLVSGQVDHEHWDQFREAILDSALTTGTQHLLETTGLDACVPPSSTRGS